MHSATFSSHQKEGDNQSIAYEEEASSFDYRLPARRASVRKQRKKLVARGKVNVSSSIDDDVSDHFERRRNTLEVPESFHIEEKVQDKRASNSYNGRLESTDVPKKFRQQKCIQDFPLNHSKSRPMKYTIPNSKVLP